jgi:uncharacterized cupredoxin-like copper-binding protein
MTTRRTLIAAAAATMALPASAHGDKKPSSGSTKQRKEQKEWGIAGNVRAATRTIAIRMFDTMRFAPERLDVKLGQTVRLAIRNDGKMLHELVIGTAKELEDHAAMMLKFPGMEHDEPYMAHVNPGKTGQIVWHFNRAGRFEFACLIAGHYQAGMKGAIHVV